MHVTGFSWDATYESLTAPGSCTACEVTQDHSAYWAPTLNFMYDNGTSVMVPQIGGMLVYVSASRFSMVTSLTIS